MPASCVPGSCQEQGLLRFVQVLATFLSVQARTDASRQHFAAGQQLHLLLQLVQQVLNEDGPADHLVRGGPAAVMPVLDEWLLTLISRSKQG